MSFQILNEDRVKIGAVEPLVFSYTVSDTYFTCSETPATPLNVL